MWVARGWKPCLDICISMWTVKDKGGSGGLLAAKPFLVGCASIYFSINTLCYDVGLLPPRRESQQWALFAGRLDGSVGGLGSVALQLGGELRWDEGCAPHSPHRHPGQKFSPPSLFSIYRLAKLMKMHACTEREAVEMITIITRLDQSSLGGLKETHVNPGLTGSPTFTHDLIDFGQLSARHLCPFQAPTPNVLLQPRHAKDFFPLLFNFMW